MVWLRDREGGKDKGFSYRLFCRKAGINSPGFISEAIGGSLNLSKAYVEKFALGLGLDAKERDYFDLMVAFTLRAPKEGTFHLEIDCDASQGCAAGGARPVYGAIHYGPPAGRTFGVVRLEKPGSIAGVLVDTLEDPDHPVWVGIAGTGLFARARKDSAADPARLAFRLEGVYPGSYVLELIRAPDSASSAMRMKTEPLKVKPGAVADAGVLRF